MPTPPEIVRLNVKLLQSGDACDSSQPGSAASLLCTSYATFCSLLCTPNAIASYLICTPALISPMHPP
eukprot:3082256-Rhodomonas_salina.6